MSGLYTIPDTITLSTRKKLTPAYMRPSSLPLAVVMPGVLTGKTCDAILEYCNERPSYNVKGCGAETRECPMPLDGVFTQLELAGQIVNEDFWNFDLDEYATAWMQTYRYPGSYHKHADGTVGQNRKLTAVAMLSDSSEYAGADLLLHTFQDPPFVIPPHRGTVAVFPSWVIHEVTPMQKGLRQTINMGWFGPPFK